MVGYIVTPIHDQIARKELERASSAVRSDHSAWEVAGGRVAEIVASMGLGEQKRNSASKQRRFSRERQRKSNPRIASTPSGQLRA
jgi:hypothetical protein